MKSFSQYLCEDATPSWVLGNLFHGTAREDTQFSPNRVAYFTPDKKEATAHAEMDSEHEGGTPVLIQAKLINPKVTKLDTRTMQDLHLHTHQEMVEKLKSQGFNVAIGSADDEIAVLDPTIIKVISTYRAR